MTPNPKLNIVLSAQAGPCYDASSADPKFFLVSLPPGPQHPSPHPPSPCTVPPVIVLSTCETYPVQRDSAISLSRPCYVNEHDTSRPTASHWIWCHLALPWHSSDYHLLGRPRYGQTSPIFRPISILPDAKFSCQALHALPSPRLLVIALCSL